MSLDAVVDLLRCPRCHGRLTRTDGQLGCREGHRFDIARQGYVNLLGAAQPANADTAGMIADRLAVQRTGLFEPVLAVLRRIAASACTERAEAVIIDAGAGPGWYLAGLLDALPAARGVAVDVSVAACRRAARAHARAGAVVADTWRELPVRSQRADVVLSAFAPRNPAEFARLVRPGGRVVVVGAGADHLVELREEFGLMDVGAPGRPASSGLRRAAPTVELRWRTTVSAETVPRLIMMGPNAFHRERPAGVGGVRQVTAHITVDELVPDPGVEVSREGTPPEQPSTA